MLFTKIDDQILELAFRYNENIDRMAELLDELIDVTNELDEDIIDDENSASNRELMEKGDAQQDVLSQLKAELKSLCLSDEYLMDSYSKLADFITAEKYEKATKLKTDMVDYLNEKWDDFN